MTSNTFNKRHPIALAVLAALNSVPAAQAACVSLTTLGAAYTQDFNTLASSGTSTLSIAGWSMLETGTGANALYTAGTGSGNAGDTYSFGSAAVPADRALGGLQSGSVAPSFGTCFINNTGATITSLPIAYTGEQWRAGVLNRGSADRIDFQYSTTATDLSTGTWTDVDALDFNSPNISTTAGLLDGNAVLNRTATSSTISSLSIANGATFWIRWTDFNIASSDDGLSVDDFSLTPNGTGGNPTVNLSVSANAGSEAGATVITVTATASAAVTGAQTVNLSLSGSGITAGDYALSNATITIPNGSTTGTVTFTVVDDVDVEGTETAILTISGPSAGISLGATTTQNITITDNEVPATPLVNLSVSTNAGSEASATAITVTATASSAVSGAQTVNLGVTGTGITAGDYSLSNSTITIPNASTTGTVTFTVVDDAAVESAETATLTISGLSAGVSLGATTAQNISIADNDVVGPTLTPIYQIQGSGATSLLTGQVITTSGVVTKVNNNGFFLQDPTGDGNANTSDGIWVFTITAPTVSVGQSIQLGGTVTEFNTGAAGNADTLAHKVTELATPTSITVLSSGNSITPTPVTLPEAVNDDLEKYEGMLVTLNGPLTADQNYFLGRYGQVTLSAGGRLENPTNKYRPGTAQAIALDDQNARSRILLDDGTSVQNPNPTPYISAVDNTLRAGDTVASITGVIDYGLATSSNTGFGDYKIHPTQVVSFTRANARTAAPTAVGGNIKVASANVLNFFTTFTNGQTADGQTGQGCSLGGAVSAANCRGADSSAEFTRQRSKIVAEIQAINADVVGLMEIQNNGNTAAQNLVDGLNAAMGAGTYATLAVPAAGTGDDAIRVAMIYKPAAVTLVGTPASDTDAINNRPTLAQTFAAPNGQQFTVVVNHFKSKGSCPATGTDPSNEDAGDGQGCWNGRRVLQAQRLRTWLTSQGYSNALIIGDLNAYGQEDPVFDLTSNSYVDQSGVFEALGYSYVFDGNAGRLDHAITSAALSPKIASVNHWHVNADEPSSIDYNLEFKQPACPACGPDYYTATQYRSSDHDPVVIGLNLNDLDGDGLSDSIEATLGTNPLDLDSDDDGIADGAEDANHNGVVDAGETNPAVADTDGDGIQDGTETGVTVGVADPDGAGPLLGTNAAVFVADADPATTTSATTADTDGDGANDGVEDANHNGRVDAGEYNPLSNLSFPPTQTTGVPALPSWAMALFALLLAAVQRKSRQK